MALLACMTGSSGEKLSSGMSESRVRAQLTLWPLVMTMFFCVSGGPYGLEPVVQSGAGVAILLIVLVPFLWAIPIALMSAELGSALPKEGGYYAWVKEAIGPRSALLCGWLTFLYSCVDVAIYPVLFVQYLGALGFATLVSEPVTRFAITLVMIAPLTWINIRGIKTTGRIAFVLAVALLLPFALMIAAGSVETFDHLTAVVHPVAAPGMSTSQALTSGLFVIMWNYLGWDSLSTIAGEVRNARKMFPRALFVAVPIVILCYLFPVLIGLHFVPDIGKWQDGSWPLIAEAMHIPLLGTAIALGGLLSAAGLFGAGLLAASRLPLVLANDGYLPSSLAKLHPTLRTPVFAIVVCSIIYLTLSRFSFEQLTEVDVLLYSAALVFEFIALIQLRRRHPQREGAYRIPGGLPGVFIVATLPLILIAIATSQMIEESPGTSLGLLAFAFLTGLVLIYFQRARIVKRSISF